MGCILIKESNVSNIVRLMKGFQACNFIIAKLKERITFYKFTLYN